MTTSTVRCAIYTRKSSEEGLDMAFNSLDAQRQADLDYISSQRGQGWVAVKTGYDDGGYSGGTTDRPGLQRLLADIHARRVDVVVVYKVDRLSRSLADFARLMQTFDEHGVSFVSVTQQFNTTTSMGRLTLNMLLSFAQFEREVAGERIRDKLAATFKRGVFVTGQPPLGYRRPKEGEPGFAERRLLIVPDEAAIVRSIFSGYLELGSLVLLAQRLNAAGHLTKRWTSSRGRTFGGKPFSTGLIHRILTNPIYLGKIAHTRKLPLPSLGPGTGRAVTELHDGLHEPIITRDLWDRVQSAMQTSAKAARTSWTHTHLLKGKLVTAQGSTMSPSSVQKRVRTHAPLAARQTSPTSTIDPSEPDSAMAPRRLIPYYISQKAIKHGYDACPIKSVNATILDDLVRTVVINHALARELPDLGSIGDSARDATLRHWIRRVVVDTSHVRIELDAQTFGHGVGWADSDANSETPNDGADLPRACSGYETVFGELQPTVVSSDGLIILTLDIDLKRLHARRPALTLRGGRAVSPPRPGTRPLPREHIRLAIGQAFAWHKRLLASKQSIDDLARAHEVSPARVKHLLTLTQLAPTILRAALSGLLPANTTLDDLINAGHHLDWTEQARLLALPTRS